MTRSKSQQGFRKERPLANRRRLASNPTANSNWTAPFSLPLLRTQPARPIAWFARHPKPSFPQSVPLGPLAHSYSCLTSHLAIRLAIFAHVSKNQIHPTRLGSGASLRRLCQLFRILRNSRLRPSFSVVVSLGSPCRRSVDCTTATNDGLPKKPESTRLRAASPWGSEISVRTVLPCAPVPRRISFARPKLGHNLLGLCGSPRGRASELGARKFR